MKSFYPIIGGTVGATGGAVVGGPGGAALGAFGGTAVGEIAKGDPDVTDVVDTVDALSKGDVETLLDIHASEQKSLFDQWVEGIYDILKISAFGMALYFVFHFWYGRKFAEKLNKKNQPNE
jgi:hypothetical protein